MSHPRPLATLPPLDAVEQSAVFYLLREWCSLWEKDPGVVQIGLLLCPGFYLIRLRELGAKFPPGISWEVVYAFCDKMGIKYLPRRVNDPASECPEDDTDPL